MLGFCLPTTSLILVTSFPSTSAWYTSKTASRCISPLHRGFPFYQGNRCFARAIIGIDIMGVMVVLLYSTLKPNLLSSSTKASPRHKCHHSQLYSRSRLRQVRLVTMGMVNCYSRLLLSGQHGYFRPLKPRPAFGYQNLLPASALPL